MKKNNCNSCKKNPGRPCVVCGHVSPDTNESETSYSTLYAAEFLLYAFHFVNRADSNVSEQPPAQQFMMLVAEG